VVAKNFSPVRKSVVTNLKSMHSLGKMQDQNSRSDAEKMRDALGDVTLGKMREMRKSIAID
jgi:hypothetical protein